MENKNAFSRHKKLLPAVVMLLTAFTFGILELLLVDYFYTSFTWMQARMCGAWVSMLLCFASYFYWRRAYKYVLIITVFLFSLGLISFFDIDASVSFNKHHFRVHPYGIFLLLIIYAGYHATINDYIFSKLAMSPEKAEAHAHDRFEEEIERFAERYKKYSDEHLELIIAENKFTPAAIETARRMLHKRKQNPSS